MERMWNAFSLSAESSSGTWIVGAPKGVSESPVVPSRALRLRGRAAGSSGSTGAGSSSSQTKLSVKIWGAVWMEVKLRVRTQR